jgi:methyl-accepting chemotaxis protein
MLRRYSLRTKLFAGFGIVLALLTLVLIGAVFLMRIMQNSNDTVSQRLTQAEWTREMEYNVVNADHTLEVYISATDPDMGRQDLSKFQDQVRQIAQLEAKIAAFPMDKALVTKLQTFDTQWKQYTKGSDQTAQYVQNGRKDIALQTKPSPDYLLSTLDQFTQQIEAISAQDNNEAQRSSTTSLIIMMGIGGAAFFIGLAIAWSLAKSILGKTKILRTIAHRIAFEGDLAAGIAVLSDLKNNSHDELEQVLQSFGTMSQQLMASFGHVKSASLQITSDANTLQDLSQQSTEASNQVAVAIEQVTHGAQRQATQLSHVHHQMVTIVQTNSELEADSQSTIASLMQLKDKIGVIAKRIQMLETQATHIVGIVETIDEIAQQTNLLSLNAAIEAARAGESGRGFTVVAGEVHKLADHSASAARTIREMLQKMRDETKQAVSFMEEGVSEVNDSVSNASRTEECVQTMTRNIHHAQIALHDIANIAEENSSVAEEIAAATEQLSAQIQNVLDTAHGFARLTHILDASLTTFKIDDEPIPDEALRLQAA